MDDDLPLWLRRAVPILLGVLLLAGAGGYAIGASDANGTPWVTWTENDSSRTSQARVAKLVRGNWQEVVGGARPINQDIDPRRGPSGAYFPRIIFFQGRPYVAYVQDNRPGRQHRGIVITEGAHAIAHVGGLFSDKADKAFYSLRAAKQAITAELAKLEASKS